MAPELFNTLLISSLAVISVGLPVGFIVAQRKAAVNRRKLFDEAPLEELWELTKLLPEERARCTLLSLCPGDLFGGKCYVKQDGNDAGYFENGMESGNAQFHCSFYEGSFWKEFISRKRDVGDWTYTVHMHGGEQVQMVYWGPNAGFHLEADNQFYEFHVKQNHDFIDCKGKRAGAYCNKPACVIAIDKTVPNHIKALICSVVCAHAGM